MLTVNIHHAKTHLSKLIDQAVSGQPFIIAKAGKPLVKVTPLDVTSKKVKSRLGGLEGQSPPIPDDFDTMFSDEIAEMFHGKG